MRNWPALIIAVVVSVYWLRVVIMVRRSRKRSGHGANLVPPEPLGRVLRIVWMPVTMLWIVLPYVAFIVKFDPQKRYRRFPDEVLKVLTPCWRSMPLAIAGAAVAVLCLWATFICWHRMGKSWRMGIDPNDKTQLVCSGPYAYVRHPIYGLSSLLMLATMAAVPYPIMLVAGVVHLVLLQWEARREEQHLIRVHGEEYRLYMRHTGRFFPRSFRPHCPTQQTVQ